MTYLATRFTRRHRISVRAVAWQWKMRWYWRDALRSTVRLKRRCGSMRVVVTNARRRSASIHVTTAASANWKMCLRERCAAQRSRSFPKRSAKIDADLLRLRRSRRRHHASSRASPKKTAGNEGAFLCAFAPLREMSYFFAAIMAIGAIPVAFRGPSTVERSPTITIAR